MNVLVLAEHNNSELKTSSLSAIKAALEIDQNVDVLVVGSACENVTNKFSQKMLEKGIMITSAFYSTYAHKDKDYDMLDNISNEVLEKLEV